MTVSPNDPTDYRFVWLDRHGSGVARVTIDAAGSCLVSAADLENATGWLCKPEGLCRGDVCVPTTLHPDVVSPDGALIDIQQFAAATDQVMVIDHHRQIVAIGPSALSRTTTLRNLDASDLREATVVAGAIGDEVGVTDFPDTKKLVVAFSSWCGCRYDLPQWQELQNELGPHGFQIVAVAVDEDPADVQPWIDEAKATFPVLLDRDRRVTERLDITNVPTVVWLDEHNHVVRPNDVAFGSDLFRDFHGIDSDPHHEALRRWVLHNEAPLANADEVLDHQVVPGDDQQLARLHFRIALELHRTDDPDGALEHFDRAGRLAPDDFTIRRASLPLRGIDPFLSDEFIALFEEWQTAGAYRYGINQTREDRPAAS